MFTINFVNNWIQTTDLWSGKRPFYQLSYNHFQLALFVVWMAADLFDDSHATYHRNYTLFMETLQSLLPLIHWLCKLGWNIDDWNTCLWINYLLKKSTLRIIVCFDNSCFCILNKLDNCSHLNRNMPIINQTYL